MVKNANMTMKRPVFDRIGIIARYTATLGGSA